MPAPLILFVVTEDWYFWSHRVDLARAALAAGYRVALAARFTAHRARLEALGIECLPLPIARSLRHPGRDLLAAARLAWLVLTRRPALLHLVALKPIVLALPAALLAPRTPCVNAIAGMGYLFTSEERADGWLARCVRGLLGFALRRRRAHTLVQNATDLALLATLGVDTARQAELVPGAGIDVDRYAPTPLPEAAAPLVVLPARMLKDKGVGEFIAAAPAVHAAHPTARLALVGGIDADNPAAYGQAELAALAAAAGVEWWGAREDMPAVYREATLVCLPSYREGLPKVLLEAAASARPLVATDVPGCRDVCREGVSGVLVPARDAPALARALIELLADPPRQARLAAGARALAEEVFAAGRIHDQTLACYGRLLGRR